MVQITAKAKRKVVSIRILLKSKLIIFFFFLDSLYNIKDPAALKKSAFIPAECQALLNENVNGIPAKEIKLAKILMDKPAPHCSA